MTEGPETVTLELLGRLIRDVQKEQREQRNEQRGILSLLMINGEQVRRFNRTLAELQDDLEQMLKAELMGRFGLIERTSIAGSTPWTTASNRSNDARHSWRRP